MDNKAYATRLSYTAVQVTFFKITDFKNPAYGFLVVRMYKTYQGCHF